MKSIHPQGYELDESFLKSLNLLTKASFCTTL